MSSALSPRAIRRILAFTEGDYSPRTVDEELNHERRVLFLEELAHNLSTSWECDRGKPEGLLGHTESLERRLILQKALGEKDMQDVFAHGKPLVYDGQDYPRLLLPKIVEAFQRLKEAPSLLDITVAVPTKNVGPRFHFVLLLRPVVSMDHPAEVWPQVYDDCLPCHACTRVETSEEWRIKNEPAPGPLRPTVQYAVEKFHVPSTRFAKQLIVELHFALGESEMHGDGDVPVRPPTASNVEKVGLHKVTIRLVDEVCSGSARIMARKSKTMLLVSDVASEVYGFLDRVYFGSSLIANRGLNDLLYKLRHLLPVHHLMCEFEEETVRRDPQQPWPTGDYWLILHHFRRDLTYSDVRRLKIHSTAGFKSTAADSALIRRYLSDSHVVDFKAPRNDARFSFKMLAALVGRNFTVDRLRLRALDSPLTDFRSMDAVFGGGMRPKALDLWIREECLEHLIKTTDFLRLPTVQGLTDLMLVLAYPIFGRHRPNESSTRRQRSVVSSPLWIAGIQLLCNCACYRIDYGSYSHLESIALKLVQICEKFERGEVSETVEHFAFSPPRRVEFPFKGENKTASGIKIQAEDDFAPINFYEWDVYRFRNATTGEWLTACVGQNSRPLNLYETVLHMAWPTRTPHDVTLCLLAKTTDVFSTFHEVNSYAFDHVVCNQCEEPRRRNSYQFVLVLFPTPPEST